MIWNENVWKMRSLTKDEKFVRENRLPLVINLLGPYVVKYYFRYREYYSFELRHLRQTWKLEGQVIFPNSRGRKYSRKYRGDRPPSSFQKTLKYQGPLCSVKVSSSCISGYGFRMRNNTCWSSRSRLSTLTVPDSHTNETENLRD